MKSAMEIQLKTSTLPLVFMCFNLTHTQQPFRDGKNVNQWKIICDSLTSSLSKGNLQKTLYGHILYRYTTPCRNFHLRLRHFRIK